MAICGQRHAPAALPSAKTRYSLYRRLDGPQGWSGLVRKISPPQGFDPRSIQPGSLNKTLYFLVSKKLHTFEAEITSLVCNKGSIRQRSDSSEQIRLLSINRNSTNEGSNSPAYRPKEMGN